MEDREPTYEEFVSARKYARFKYKYGIFVLILCWICLLFLCYFVYSYGEEISSNPFIYGARKANLDCQCTCTTNQNQFVFLNINSSTMAINKAYGGSSEDDINWSSIN